VSQRIDLDEFAAAQGQLILEAAEETAGGIVFRVRAKQPPRCLACFESRVSYTAGRLGECATSRGRGGNSLHAKRR
jgi:hypothetical protein